MEYYLDANAHLPLNLSASQIKKSQFHGNPMSPNLPGRNASIAIEKSREQIASLLGAKDPSSIIFTNSCTEANYWACIILTNHYLIGYNTNVPTINISPYEHSSINDSLPLLPFDKTFISLDKCANINEISNSDYSIFIGVQNEIGSIANFPKIRQNTKDLFMSDLAQAIGRIHINLDELNIDIATFGAHKFGGPNGVGILYLKDPSIYAPINSCKSYNFDVPGSMNVSGICQTAIALKNSIESMNDRMDKAKSFRCVFENIIKQMDFSIVGEYANRIYSTSLIKPNKISGIDLLLGLEKYNIFVGLGSACGSIIKQPLRSAIALGYKDAINTDFIRISQNGDYDDKDAQYICGIIEKIIDARQ